MDHQDWTAIDIGNKNNLPLYEQRASKILSKSNMDAHSRKLNENGDEFKTKTWSSTNQKNVQKLRLSLKLDQKQFAQQLNVPVSVIQNIENKKGIYDGKLVDKINRRYKVSLNSET
jgi:DNA-binding transcriptional regulator YiaG